MIDYFSLAKDDLPMSMQYFRKRLKELGWKAEKLCRESRNDLILTRPDGVEVRVASSTPPTTSVFALHLADNKLMSYELLKEIGVPQPETIPVREVQDAARIIEKYKRIIIKPVDGAHGRGVTINITSLDQVGEAISKAKAASQGLNLAIAQPQLPTEGTEMRVICIGYKFIVAMRRIPARVTGDGQHSLAELIEIENRTLRTAPYQSDLAYIDKVAAEKYLGERLHEIPAENERVRVVASCNIGQGGVAEDCSGEIAPEVRDLAEKIAVTAQLPVIGIDFYGDQVIEINACPTLYYPTGDESATRAIKAYIDYLAEL